MEHLISRLVDELTANMPAAESHVPPQVPASTDPDQVDHRFARADARDVLARHQPVEAVGESTWDDITSHALADPEDRQIGDAADGEHVDLVRQAGGLADVRAVR